MPNPSYEQELRVAVNAAREAAEFIRSAAGRVSGVREKSKHDLVTEADEAVQRLIIDRIEAAFPDHGFLAEEGDAHSTAEQDRGRPRWIIDPIDGTTNFTHGLPPYCVSIALQDERGALVVGVVHEVAMDEVFAAVKGHGITLNGRTVEVTKTDALNDCLATTGFPFREYWYVEEYLDLLKRFMFETRGIRRPGSAAADLAYVACGRFDIFFEAGLSPWDLAAGIVLVEEAGGTVTGLTEEADPLRHGQILATNGRIHEAALAMTRSLGRKHLDAILREGA